MNAAELEYLRTYLLEQKGKILNKTKEFREQQLAGSGAKPDEVEVATQDLSMNLSLHLHERDRSSLLKIEKALGKIAEGTYGQCDDCHGDIEFRRMVAQPFAHLCISCMEEAEDPRNFLN